MLLNLICYIQRISWYINCRYSVTCTGRGTVDFYYDYKLFWNSIKTQHLARRLSNSANIRNWFDLLCLKPLSAIFQLNHGYQLYGGRSKSTQREPPTMSKELVNFITCGCESNAPFFVNYKAGREPTQYWW